MTADEMFEQLGFKKDTDRYIREKSTSPYAGREIIWFERDEENCVYCQDDYEPMRITMDILQAIIKKCDELGWE